MSSIIEVRNVTKKYADGKVALADLSIDITAGEIIALLGPNGAGKTSLISLICGLTTITDGTILVDGLDVEKNYRETRSIIGLVPQELMLEPFETVWGTVNLSRGLFGRSQDSSYIEKLLRQLSLWDKRHSPIRELSGGMKRRVLIAKALSHEPKILFLDEPTAGVDVDLRRDMWVLIRDLSKSGVTVVLTTHYIEEAEEIADRIAVINQGKILLIEEKSLLMKRLGKKKLLIDLNQQMANLSGALSNLELDLSEDGKTLFYNYLNGLDNSKISKILGALSEEGVQVDDVRTEESSLEDIFVELVAESRP
ncbi:MAG: multidrug ABC transporter ATP-binding protein [Legionellales bacterium]|jgi:ABC-2 type transport system ATP-binding protein|nr:multidrug ABC transporter ATP-binding protein [Legionellales bacterium]